MDSMEIISPLTGVTDTVNEIADLVMNFRTCTTEWKQLAMHMKSAATAALEPVNEIDAEQSDVKTLILTLQGTLDGIAKKIRARQKDSLLLKISHFRNHSIVIDEIRQEVDNAFELFTLGMETWTRINMERLEQLNANHTLDPLLNKLRYISGASWNEHQICLPDTRQHIIDRILSWANSPVDEASDATIFLLTGISGSGKSAIAHTVSQQLSEVNQLATSFFFDRETAERNNPKWLISTIVFELCQKNDLLARRIASAIEEDKGLIGASISRQFQRLILDPSQGFTCSPPLVIILDALDEGCDSDLLQILTGDASKLPPSIRILLTSRMSPEISSLRRKLHVRSAELEIYNQDNTRDITRFVSSKLRDVADFHELGDDWPEQSLVESFKERAEGLFLWVATTCAYLESCYYPKKELQRLLAGSHTDSSPESKMDDLYVTILETCNWKDKEFSENCHTLLGAAVATKSPLTLRALNSLYQRVIMDSETALRQLSPLLAGLSNKPRSPPVRFLHQSLHEFLTLRAPKLDTSSPAHKFAIDEKSHSRKLGLLCIELMNQELQIGMPGVGYSSKQSEVAGIPSAKGHDLSEELLYACRFWVDHVMDIELSAEPNTLAQLEQLLRDKLVLWMELMATCGRYEGLSKAHQWQTDSLKDIPSLGALLLDKQLATVSRDIAERLQYMDRLEEALIAARDEVVIHRNLVEGGDTESRGDLARALISLSIYLSELALREDALKAANEAVLIQRELAASGASESKWNLARSLWCQSVSYRSTGRYDDALVAAEEAVEIQRKLRKGGDCTSDEHKQDFAKSLRSLAECLGQLKRYNAALAASTDELGVYRQLFAKQPSKFKPDLAHSLAFVVTDYWHTSQYDEMLVAAQEAVDLGRQLTEERPVVFSPYLAKSLRNLSLALGELGRHEEALPPNEEAVELHRQLAKERPVIFNPELTKSLLNLSIRLSDLGQHDEALAIDHEAIRIRRKLANERPAVFTEGLARSLYNLAIGLSTSDRHDEALEAILESLEFRRQLIKERPDDFTRDLADSLAVHILVLSNLGRDDEASEVQEELDAMGLTDNDEEGKPAQPPLARFSMI